MTNDMKKQFAEVMGEIASSIKSGEFGKKPVIGLTISGSEHGQAVMAEACLEAFDGSFKIALIGPLSDELKAKFKGKDGIMLYEVGACQADEHKKMEELLDSGEIDACVTNHYNFPIGVSTVGMVTTPAKGKNLILATTTGTSATNRIEAMLRNAIAGVITAKAVGIERPTIGILNVDGARGTEMALKKLRDQGYDLDFVESARADGGVVMRGNDLLLGTPDVMVTDSLTGNLLVKMFSSYTTGGNYEATGFAYGPGVGKNFSRKVLIISRASGAAVIANALRFGAKLVKGNLSEIAVNEYNKADKAGLEEIAASLNKEKESSAKADVKMPDKEVVTEQLSGIDIMDLDDAVMELMKNGIYAESGMGCTGPIILVSPANGEKATDLLKKAGFMN